jgi:predicted transposase YbfD/YdcC
VIGALEQELRLVLGQVQVPQGANEIKAVLSLLTGLILEGRVVTMDALLTQHEIAEVIRQKEGTT